MLRRSVALSLIHYLIKLTRPLNFLCKMSLLTRREIIYLRILYTCTHPPPLRARTTRRREITRTRHAATGNRNIIEHKITTTTTTTKNIIILRTPRRRAGDVLEQQVRDDDAVGWVTGWAAVQVVLLHVDAVDGDVADGDVAVRDIRDETCGVEIRLDACAGLGVEDLAVGELRTC